MVNAKDSITVNGVGFTHGQIWNVVSDFYRKVEVDPDLGPAFKSVHDWPEHVERLTHFWWIRFGGKPYMFTHYNPVLKHFYAGFNQELLIKWLFLFKQTLPHHLNSEQIKLWSGVVERMGESLLARNNILHQEAQHKKNQS